MYNTFICNALRSYMYPCKKIPINRTPFQHEITLCILLEIYLVPKLTVKMTYRQIHAT